jgi:hypothetical protein
MYVHEIEEVEVAMKIKARKEDKDLFWEKILGTKPSKKTIQVINPEDVFFFYNSGTQVLTVSCRVPLQIVNHEIGYHIQFVLNHFTHSYRADLSSWEGKPIFRELEPKNFKQKQFWEKNRKKVYQVSTANFIRAC